jgi:acetyl-CoA carboxylase biotin carboxyl carrier protein|uniref:Biotin carboxyl carrier protein of acetyl-CoA carboxylase n=1 Tax=candidate division WOR-3 bacterium TaxID=2052148 RepID=A0A7V3RGC8_UNCW3
MNIKKIRELVKILEESPLSEIEFTDFWGRKLRLSKGNNVRGSTITPPRVEPSEAKKVDSTPVPEVKIEEQEKKEEKPRKNLVAIRSPIVGTFYRAPAPDAPPYVEVGDIVKPGQVVCIVEAMKLMNEIESDVAGKVVEILVKNEEPVEYNQELFLIEPM